MKKKFKRQALAGITGFFACLAIGAANYFLGRFSGNPWLACILDAAVIIFIAILMIKRYKAISNKKGEETEIPSGYLKAEVPEEGVSEKPDGFGEKPLTLITIWM